MGDGHLGNGTGRGVGYRSLSPKPGLLLPGVSVSLVYPGAPPDLSPRFLVKWPKNLYFNKHFKSPLHTNIGKLLVQIYYLSSKNLGAQMINEYNDPIIRKTHLWRLNIHEQAIVLNRRNIIIDAIALTHIIIFCCIETSPKCESVSLNGCVCVILKQSLRISMSRGQRGRSQEDVLGTQLESTISSLVQDLHGQQSYVQQLSCWGIGLSQLPSFFPGMQVEPVRSWLFCSTCESPLKLWLPDSSPGAQYRPLGTYQVPAASSYDLSGVEDSWVRQTSNAECRRLHSRMRASPGSSFYRE